MTSLNSATFLGEDLPDKVLVEGKPPMKTKINEAENKKRGARSEFITPQELVWVKVGNEKFRLHKDFLVFNSPYFRAAFTGRTQEAETGIAVLEGTDPKVFDVFVEWLYTGHVIDVVCVQESLTEAEKYKRDQPTLDNLIKLWVLAERLQVPRLQNMIVENIILRYQRRHTADIDGPERVYEITQPGSPLRRLYTDLYTQGWTGERYDEALRLLPTEMVIDMVIRLKARFLFLMKGNLRNLDAKDYFVYGRS